jgi:hypothetical protein
MWKYSVRRFGMDMPKAQDIQAKIPLPKAIWNEFWPAAVNKENSGDDVTVNVEIFREAFWHGYAKSLRLQRNEARAGRGDTVFSALRKDIHEKKETRNFQSGSRKHCRGNEH